MCFKQICKILFSYSRCTKYTTIPKQCVLIQDPKKPCCQVPYCDYKNPTPFPNGIPTPRPGLVPTPGPGVITVAPYISPSFTSISGPSPTPGQQGSLSFWLKIIRGFELSDFGYRRILHSDQLGSYLTGGLQLHFHIYKRQNFIRTFFIIINKKTCSGCHSYCPVQPLWCNG